MKDDTEELAKAGEEIYETRLKALLEPKYRGKIVAIEVESGEYFLGDREVEAFEKGRKKHPAKVFYFKRVGFRAVHTVCQTL